MIPPAWTHVWICPAPNGHIQAVGTDDAGRRQYLYHPAWREQRDKAKHDRVLAVAAAPPRGPRHRGRPPRPARDAAGAGARHGVPAARPRVLPRRRRAVRRGQRQLRPGHDREAARPRARPTRSCSTTRRSPARSASSRWPTTPSSTPSARCAGAAAAVAELLAYKDGERWRDLTSTDINRYVKDVVGGDVSAKDFRTWHGTVLAAVALAERADDGRLADAPQAGDPRGDGRRRRLPRQHPDRRPRLVRRPAPDRRLRGAARRSLRRCAGSATAGAARGVPRRHRAGRPAAPARPEVARRTIWSGRRWRTTRSHHPATPCRPDDLDVTQCPPRAAVAAGRPSRTFAVLAGLVAAGVALGVAELLAGLNRTWRSPVLDVGDRLIDAAPPFVKEFAIETFGTNDKPALLIGIGVFLAVYAASSASSDCATVSSPGVVGIGLFGVIGVWASSSRRAATPWHAVLPSVLGTLAGIAALVADRDRCRARPAAWTRGSGRRRAGRRQFLQRSGPCSGALAFGAGLAGGLGRRLGQRFTATESRAAVRLPAPAERLAPLPAGAMVDAPDMTPFVTPNADFYRIDTALVAPQVRTEDYTLTHPRHGRRRDLAVLRRPAGPRDDRARHHADVRVERGRRSLRRQRPLARHPPGRPARARPVSSRVPTRSSGARSTASRAGSLSPTRSTGATRSSSSA